MKSRADYDISVRPKASVWSAPSDQKGEKKNNKQTKKTEFDSLTFFQFWFYLYFGYCFMK